LDVVVPADGFVLCTMEAAVGQFDPFTLLKPALCSSDVADALL
jgi:hypothetical protein